MSNKLLKVFDDQSRPRWISHDRKNTFPLGEGDPTLDNYPFKGGEPDWDRLREMYGDAVYINNGTPLEWREVVLTVPNADLESNLDRFLGKELILPSYKTDSFTIQAQRKGVVRCDDFLETGVYGFTKTDGSTNLIIGTRGGSESVGQLIIVPGGAVGYDDGIDAALIREANEEAGIVWKDIDERYLMGAFRQMQDSCAPSNVFVYGIDLKDNVPGEEILERHLRAMEVYHSVKALYEGNDFEKELAARVILKARGAIYQEELPLDVMGGNKFPVDAWENQRLELIANDPEVIMQRARDVIVDGDGLKHGMYAGLFVYFMSEFGQDYAEKLLELPGFRDNLDLRGVE